MPVPVRGEFEFSFADPLGIVFNDAFDIILVRDVEFFQPDPD
jgi:hypothetical protein